jgi:hypothetical protein
MGFISQCKTPLLWQNSSATANLIPDLHDLTLGKLLPDQTLSAIHHILL